MMRRPVASLLLDVDRVSSVFALLFAFVRDDACDDTEARSFDSTMSEILRGLALPSGARERLHTLFDKEMDDPASFDQLVDSVARDFADDRLMLPVILELVLRVSSEDGMVSRCDAGRIRSLLARFDLNEAELDSLPDEDHPLIEAILYGQRRAAPGPQNVNGTKAQAGSRAARVLAGHYQVLGCRPDVSDAELRRIYRKLVMRYHPDRSKIADAAPDERSESPREGMRSSGKFEAVQSAYEAIKRARGA